MRTHEFHLSEVCALVEVQNITGINSLGTEMCRISVDTDMLLSSLSLLLLLCGLAVGQPSCKPECTLSIVESIPENLTYPASSPSHLSTYKAWMTLLSAATQSVDIASYYWTLRGNDVIKDVTDKQGWEVYNKLASFANSSAKVRIVENIPTKMFPDSDTTDLVKSGAALVQKLNFTALEGIGLLHTKLWIVDQKHFYAGSANMDWRSLTQVKEMGLLGMDCECLARDAKRLFEVYWNLSSPSATVPSHWGPEYTALYSEASPAHLLINGTMSDAFWSSSPPAFCASQRTKDIDALVNVINSAEKFVYVAVMDYIPAVIYENPEYYWAVIDDALRSAAYNRGVHVRLLGSYWKHTRRDMVHFLKSLSDNNGTGEGGIIETRMFVVPELTNKDIPFTRVNHNKYMVSDKTAFITTSNWSGDYYVATGGVSCSVTPPPGAAGNSLQHQLLQVFERDWSSPYSYNITNLPPV